MGGVAYFSTKNVSVGRTGAWGFCASAPSLSPSPPPPPVNVKQTLRLPRKALSQERGAQEGSKVLNDDTKNSSSPPSIRFPVPLSDSSSFELHALAATLNRVNEDLM